MLNFKQSLYKSLITFANGGDDEAGFCFFISHHVLLV